MSRIKPIVDTNLLSDSDVERLNKEAAKKISDERKKLQSDAYLAQQIEHERAKSEPMHEMVEVTIDLPAYTTNMLIDGVYYHHGTIVPVPRHMADSIRDNMSRAWILERQMGNPNLRDYSPVRERSVSALSSGSV